MGREGCLWLETRALPSSAGKGCLGSAPSGNQCPKEEFLQRGWGRLGTGFTSEKQFPREQVLLTSLRPNRPRHEGQPQPQLHPLASARRQALRQGLNRHRLMVSHSQPILQMRTPRPATHQLVTEPEEPGLHYLFLVLSRVIGLGLCFLEIIELQAIGRIESSLGDNHVPEGP